MNTKPPAPQSETQPKLYPTAPERFELGDKRRFHWRILNDRYEVYSIGLDQWAECATQEHAAAVADALEAFYISPFLRDLTQRMRTQDNRCTADPFFLVQECVRHYGYDPEGSDRTVFVDCDGEECAEDDVSATETGYVDRWEYVTGCFTEQGAKDYIAANRHRHKGELRIYADSLYRNREMIELRAHLLEQINHQTTEVAQ